MYKKPSVIIVLVTVALLSAGSGAWAYAVFFSGAELGNIGVQKVVAEIRQSAIHGNQLTNPLLECREFPEHILIGQRIQLEKDVEALLKEFKQRGDIFEASVYFRELVGGPWFGIEEDKKFSPASLLKLPLALSFYWRAEDEPAILEQKIEYEKGAKDYEFEQPYGPNQSLENGKVYSVRELIELMLRESSNEAALVLTQIAGAEQLQSVYSDFGFDHPAMGQDYEIDVHTYGSFFRVLFNATYLNRNASETILAVLTKTAFHDGLVAGVPADVAVAHKFGSREIQDQTGSKQLHDCGIVYAKNPYILCVMTRGNDFATLATFIREVSEAVYQGVTSSGI